MHGWPNGTNRVVRLQTHSYANNAFPRVSSHFSVKVPVIKFSVTLCMTIKVLRGYTTNIQNVCELTKINVAKKLYALITNVL